MSKKTILIISAFALLLLSFLIKTRQKTNEIKIGILQTASFPQLDQVKETFVTEMKKKYGDHISFIEQNAQGSLTQAQAIASSFQANKSITAFYAIASIAVQTLKNEIKDRPIVFAAVTDPNALHLRELGTNITGTSDMANIKRQIDILTQLMPELKKVAILYNPGETNSVTLVKYMKEELTAHHIEFEETSANSQADVAVATQKATSSSQLILIPTDVTMTSAFPLINQIAQKANIPIVTTWTGEQSGPLMQFGVDYKKSGIQAAQIMEEILNGRKPQDIPVAKPESQVILSQEMLKKFSLSVPKSMEKEVVFIK